MFYGTEGTLEEAYQIGGRRWGELSDGLDGEGQNSDAVAEEGSELGVSTFQTISSSRDE